MSMRRNEAAVARICYDAPMRGALWRRIAAASLLAAATIGARAEAAVSILNDGANGEAAMIRIHSAITRGDLARFGAAVARIDAQNGNRINDIPFVTVELDSPGGDVVEAVEIGRAIHQRFMMTLVRPGHECVSACVFILVAGAVHTPADDASIGLHRPLLVSWRNMTSTEAHARYDDLMRYLHDYFLRLGVSEAVWSMMMRTDSDDMRYFGPRELDQLGLRGEDPAWERLYDLKWAGLRPRPRNSYADLPKLAEIGEKARDLIFMPGAFHLGQDYFAGVRLPETQFTWQSVDDDELTPAAGLPDLGVLIERLAQALGQYFAPVWLLLLVGAIEVLRNRRSGVH